MGDHDAAVSTASGEDVITDTGGQGETGEELSDAHGFSDDLDSSASARSRDVLSSLRSGSFAVPTVLAAMVVLFSVLRPDTFGTASNLRSLLTTQAVLLVLALGMTIVLAVGEFDLSSAAVVGLSASLVAHLTVNAGLSVPLAIGAALGVAVIIGVVNATFVVALGLSSFIITLGMGTVVLGIGLGVVGPTTIGGLPRAATAIGQTGIAGVGLPFFYGLLLTVGLWYLLQRTSTGRHMFFTGEGRAAARLVGVRVDRIRFGALVAGSLIAGAAGVLLATQIGAAAPNFGNPLLLPAYAAPFLGATLRHGRFNAVGTFLAVYLLAVGTTGLQMLGSPEWLTQTFSGTVLVLAVTLAHLTSGRRER
jgi:ribose transport system permease protein